LRPVYQFNQIRSVNSSTP